MPARVPALDRPAQILVRPVGDAQLEDLHSDSD
jgi:hypothetical protein